MNNPKSDLSKFAWTNHLGRDQTRFGSEQCQNRSQKKLI